MSEKTFKIGGRYLVRSYTRTLYEIECIEISPSKDFMKVKEQNWEGWKRIDDYQLVECLPLKSAESGAEHE